MFDADKALLAARAATPLPSTDALAATIASAGVSIHPADTPPETPVDGDMWYDTKNQRAYVCTSVTNGKPEWSVLAGAYDIPNDVVKEEEIEHILHTPLHCDYVDKALFGDNNE